MSQGFDYEWHSVDWTGHLLPWDEPGLTAVRITPTGGAGRLGVHALEVCVE